MAGAHHLRGAPCTLVLTPAPTRAGDTVPPRRLLWTSLRLLAAKEVHTSHLLPHLHVLAEVLQQQLKLFKDCKSPCIVFAEVSIQYFMDNKWYGYGPVCSLAPLGKKNGGLDDEAPKKAMTDALTKAFSHLGVSADVFLGLFDNNKYVSDMKEKFSKPQVADASKINLVK